MTFTDLQLRFPDEATAADALTAAGIYTEDGIPESATVAVLGAMYEPQEDPDAEPVAIDGWHVDVRLRDGHGLDLTALEPYTVAPDNPRHVWG